METSLARQLKKLAVPQTSLLFPERVKKSFLFEPSEIANLSIDEIYEIGIGGIKALQNVQRKFEAFESLLFSEKSKSFERSVQTAEVNAKLDSNINEFLILLSPHFFLRPAHKALEWLVCRYHIHMFNVDALIFCVLPYHETKYFSRVLQMIDLDNPAGTWHWLKPIQKAGVFLPRSTLYTHCFAEPSILKLICELVPNAINVHGENSSNLRVIVSFYAMTVVGTLANANRVTESLLSTLLPYILRGLKSKNKHYCISAYFIIYQLIGKCTIQEELLAEIVTRITKNLFPKIMKVGILCLLNIYQHQQIKTFPMKALFDIKNNSHFLDAFESMSKRYDLIRIIVPILQKLIPSALKENVIKTRICKKKSLFEFLKSFLDTIELPKAAVLEYGKLLLMQQRKMNKLKTKKKSIKMKLFRNKTSSILAYLEKRYPDSIEEVLEKYVQKMPKKCRLIQKILNLSLSNSKHEISSDTNVSLFLGVNHPTDFIRIVSTKTFVQKVIQKELTDENFIKNTIISRLEDRHPEIVYLVLSLETNLFEIVSEDVVFRIFVDLFNKDEENSDWFKVQNKAMELLCNHQFENKVQFLAVIFSHLISRNSKDLKIVKSILTSHINKNYSLLLDAAVPVDTINKMMEEKNLQNIVYLNCKIIEMIGQSLLRMETQQWKILINLTKTASYLKAKELPLNVIIALVYEFLIKHEAKQENQLNIGFGAIKYYYFLLKTKKLSSLKNADSFEEVMEQWIKSRKNKFPSNLLIYCLNSLVKCIKYEFEKTAQWLNWESTELKNKERILLQLFNVFTEQMNLVNSTLKDEFQRLFAEFLKLQLPILKDKLMFLSSLWSTNFLKLQSKDLLLSISSVQQIRSLITAGIIVSKSKESTDWIFDNGSTVFLSLLIALSSDSEEVRKACLNFLQNAIEKCTRKDIIYFQLANKILQKHEAILSDHEQFFQIISSWFLSPKDSSEKVNRLQLIVCQLYQEKIPNYIKHGLLFVLKDTNSKELLSLLLPFVKSRLDTLEQEPITLVDYEMCNLLLSKYSPSIANVINSIDCEAFIILEKAFKISKVCEENNKNIQEITFSIFTKDFFFNIPSKSVQQKLFSELIDFCLNCIELKCKNSLSKIIRKLCYDANLLVSELQKFNEISVTTMKETKGLRSSKAKSNTVEIFEEDKWKKIIFLLEIIENKKKIEHPELLFPVIFDLFKRSLEIENHPSAEYLRQVILSSLFNCYQLLEDVRYLDEQKFQVELIVQCIRISNNPQTQNQALLLLNLAAKLFPEYVLHNIMAIFTFMGANLVRQDNSYSFQVISQTLETIIPALLQASSQNQGDRVQTVASVTRVFVDALPDIPAHRRQSLFVKLLSILEFREFLWVVIAQVFDICVTRKVKDESSEQGTKIPSSIMDFITLLCQHCSADVQLATFIQLTKYLIGLPNENEIEDKKKLKGVSEPFDVMKHTVNQLKHFKYNTMSFMVSLLSSQVFISQLLDINLKKVDMDILYEEFMELILEYIQKLSHLIKMNEEDFHIKFWKAFLHKCYDLLDKVNSLLPSKHFINVIKTLIKHPLSMVRCKSLEMFSAKMLYQQDFFALDNHPALISFVKPLVKFIKNNEACLSSESGETESILNSQTSFYCLKLLCKTLGSTYPDKFRKLIDVIILVLRKHKVSLQLTSSALLCLAEMCRSLGIQVLPNLNEIMQSLLDILENTEILKSNSLLLISSLTTVQHLVENLSPFLSSYLHQLLTDVSIISAVIPKKDNQNASVHQCLTTIFKQLALTVPLRVLLPSIENSYDAIKTDNYRAVEPLMFTFTTKLTSLEKSELDAYLPNMQKFLLKIFDFRCENTMLSLKEIETYEAHIIEAFGFLILKLSETTFRPLFLQLFDWATRSDRVDRVLTFYKVTNILAEKLKSLFILFVGHFIRNAASLLDKNNKCKDGDYFTNEKVGVEKACLLLKSILSTLHKCFLYDNEKFVDKTLFNAIMQPIVDQIENDIGSDEDYQDRIINYVSPCIAQFAVALADDTLWKPVNYQIMLKSRHNSPKVRFATLHVLYELVQKLGENYLILLPESIPFLAELMEDECPEVEKQCHVVLSDMEKVLNEPLMKYF